MISFRTTKSRRAFTLIELLIVITIIGVLAVALIPKIAGAPGRARDAQRKADLNTIAIAMESYYADFGFYPDYDTGSCLNSTSGLTGYFNASDIPGDPSSTSTLGSCTADYYYRSLDSTTSPQHYVIVAQLENDPVTSTTKAPGLIKAATVVTASGTLVFATIYTAVSTGESCNDGTTNTCTFAITK